MANFFPQKFTFLCALLVGLLITINSYAQQVPQVSLFMFDKFLYNPAYAGQEIKTMVVSLDNRQQYMGFDGAPLTNQLTIHSPVGFGRVAVGGRVLSDVIGPVYTTGVWGTLNYNINLSNRTNQKISIALEPGFLYRNTNFGDLKLSDATTDPVFNSASGETSFTPDLNLGVFFNAPSFFGGASVRHLLPFRYGNTDYKREVYSEYKRHFFVMAGGNLEIGYNWIFRPSTLIKFLENGEYQIDIVTAMVFKEKFHFGGTFRTDGSIIPFLGFNLLKNFFLGYSYDLQLSEFADYHTGSHEIMVQYRHRWKNNPIIRQIVDPRYYY